MVDFKKHLPEAQKTTREFHVAQVREGARLRALLFGPDPRPAAEIMTEELVDLHRFALAAGLNPQGTNLNAGPVASQIFSAAVMREQVDPS